MAANGIEKLSDIELSDTTLQALSDLESVEFEFTIEEPQAKPIAGRVAAFMREKSEKPN